MILIDPQGPNGQQVAQQFQGYIRRMGVKAEIERLVFGDFAFEGHGGMTVGIERKRLHDMLACIDDSRFTAHQRPGLRRMYQEHWLLLEGCWRAHDPKGLLMEGNTAGAWWECKPAGRNILYSKLRRYLFSVVRSGTPIIETRDEWESAFDIVELFHYYQKKEHTSQTEKQKIGVASLSGRPSLARRWAEELDGVGQKHGTDAARQFKTGIALATSEEIEWMCIKGIGAATARDIMRQINGGR